MIRTRRLDAVADSAYHLPRQSSAAMAHAPGGQQTVDQLQSDSGTGEISESCKDFMTAE